MLVQSKFLNIPPRGSACSSRSSQWTPCISRLFCCWLWCCTLWTWAGRCPCCICVRRQSFSRPLWIFLGWQLRSLWDVIFMCCWGWNWRLSCGWNWGWNCCLQPLWLLHTRSVIGRRVDVVVWCEGSQVLPVPVRHVAAPIHPDGVLIVPRQSTTTPVLSHFLTRLPGDLWF